MEISTQIEIKSLDGYLEVQRTHYAECIESIDHELEIDGFNVTLRFKHLKFDCKGQPKFNDLAKTLAEYIVRYVRCIRTRDTQRRGKLSKEEIYAYCRDWFRTCKTSGEAGEILLYFLIESVLQAPQMVAKMESKTHTEFEVLGADGIHMKWNQQDELLDVYFGEAKLHADIYGALDSIFKSLKKFYDDGQWKQELRIVTPHYKWADEKLKDAVLQFVNPEKPNCRFNHACLVGYDWGDYAELLKNPKIIVNEFKRAYSDDTSRLRTLLQTRFNKDYGYDQILYEVFYLPFKSVQEFRDCFRKAIGISS